MSVVSAFGSALANAGGGGTAMSATEDLLNNNNNNARTMIMNATATTTANANLNAQTMTLPEILEGITKSEHFPTVRHRWNTNEEIAALLIALERHEQWLSEEVKIRWVLLDEMKWDDEIV